MRRAAGALLAAAAAGAAGGCAPRSPAARPVVLPPAAAPPVVAPGEPPAGQPAPGTPPALDSVRVRSGSGVGDRRFLITAVDDSTVTLLAPQDRWLRPGTYGIAVDPRRRDALVARLYVQGRAGDTVVALVTGQTTRLSTDYAAVFRRPETPVLRQASFWGGLATGLAAGAGVAILLLRGR